MGQLHWGRLQDLYLLRSENALSTAYHSPFDGILRPLKEFYAELNGNDSLSPTQTEVVTFV